MLLGSVSISPGMQQSGVAAFSVTPVPCMGESQPRVGLLVMPPRVTVLMAVSHPDTLAPGRAAGGSAFTWLTCWLAGEQGGTSTAPQTPTGLGPGGCGTIWSQGKVTAAPLPCRDAWLGGR